MSIKRGFLFHDKIIPKNSVGVEIGVFKGNFARKILRYVDPKLLYLIDPWKFRPGFKRHKFNGKIIENQAFVDKMYDKLCREFDRPNIKIIRGYSYDVFNNFKDNYFDWVYVDGNHSFKAVYQDISLFYPKLKVGGLMIGDDYFIKGERVKNAVDKFTKENGIKYNVKGDQFWFKRRR